MQATGVALMIFAAFSGQTTKPTGVQAAVPAGWVTERSPYGFVVAHPPGWVVQPCPSGLVLVRSGDKTSGVMIQPFWMQRPQPADAVVRQVPQVYAQLFPQARVDGVRRVRKRPDEVLASMIYVANESPARAGLLCRVDGSGGMLFGIAAPQHQFASQRATMVAMLQTFRYTQPTQRMAEAGGGASSVQWVKWTDPRENAFTMDVPRGWSVSGGLIRLNPVDPRGVWQIVSPDGQIRITGGDAQIPLFTEPSALLAQTGFPEGSWYSPGYGVKFMVRRYLTGTAFAQEYVATKVASGLAGLNATTVRDRPDAVQALNAIYSQFNTYGVVSLSLTAGEVHFTCRKGGQPLGGYYFAATQRTQGQGFAQWMVQWLFGYLAAQDKAALAQSVMTHVIGSIRLNPQWVRMQQQLTANVSQIVARTSEEISQIIHSTWQHRQNVYDDLARKWSNMILGQTDVVDPLTGETWKVASGHNYYWRKMHTDTMAGTTIFDPPDMDFTPLKEW